MREGSRDSAQGIIVSVFPDVCLTPCGNAMVPIPYTLSAKQSDDANTAPTVRATGLRVHNMGSLVTTCTGDEAGTGGGVSSGTQGGICEPMEHSASVRAEGKYMVRNSDRWWMNNRNTIGRLIYVQDMGRYAPTPAARSATRDLGRSSDEGRIVSDAAPEPLRAGAQYAQAAPMLPEVLPEIPVEEVRPANENVPPPLPGPGGPTAGPTVVPPPAPAATGFFQDFARSRLPGSGDPIWLTGLEGPLTLVTQLPGGWFQLADGHLVTQAQLEEIYAARKKAAPQASPEPVPLPDPAANRIRVTGGDKRVEDCIVGEYRAIANTCASQGQQAHHIVPDRSFRLGTPSSPRLEGAPDYNQGLAVCVDPNVDGPDSEHSRIHAKYFDRQAEDEARGGSFSGLLPLGRVENLGAESVEKGTGGRCNREFIRGRLRRYHQGLGLEPDLLVRADRKPLDARQQSVFGTQPAPVDIVR